MNKDLSATYREYLVSLVLFHLAAANHVGLTATDYQALNVLGLHGGMSTGELAARLGLSISAATRAVDRLVNAGYARRSPHADDRRVVLVELTGTLPPGLAELLADVRRPIASAIGKLSSDQRAGLERYFEAATAAFTAAASGIGQESGKG
jgi:DNA-binding MarR family transcriptional regulator